MLRTTVLAMLAGAVLVVAVPALALPPGGPLYPGAEKFDDYALGIGDPNYAANWAVPPGMFRIPIGNKKPSSPPNVLYVISTEGYGIEYDLYPDFQAVNPHATGLNGTDANPIIQQFYMRNKSCKNRNYTSFFVQLSMGGVQAPSYPHDGTLLPVIAFGWCRGMGTGNSITPKYFDGQMWHALGSTDQTCKGNILKTLVNTNTVAVDNLKDGGYPPQIRPRAYLGSFDTITLRAPNNDGKERSVDDIWLVDGVLTGPPIQVDVDILPSDDPNLFTPNKKGRGKLPIAILGSADLAATDIDPESVLIAGIEPLRTSTDKDEDGDGLVDLVVHINRRDLIDALSLDAKIGETVAVDVTAACLPHGWAIEGQESIVIVPLD